MTNRIGYPRHLSIPFICFIIILIIYLCNILSYFKSSANPSSSAFEESKKIIISPKDPKIRYTGRIDFSNPKRPTFTYPGVSIKLNFKGTSIVALLEDSQNGRDGYNEPENNFYTVILDDSIFSVLKLSPDESEYMLAKDLKDGPHTIEIIKRTESFVGKTGFIGFKITGEKELLDLPKRPERRLEFIGNSITCGYGNEGEKAQEKFRASTENNYMAYGSITSRNLNAECVEVCFSGIGVFRNFGGGMENTMPVIYDRIMPDNEFAKWNFTGYRPHGVIIDLGTNDFYMGHIPDSASFVNAYEGLVKTVRSKYPESKLFCVVGPLMNGKAWKIIQRDVNGIVNRMNGKGDKDVFYYAVSPCSGTGSDYHPNVTQHKKMAEELTPFVKEKMGW